ncbi:zinc-dependent alcohol dehydrogenase [Thermoanaerobacterium sp. DL9XJH110]|uniref:zinc-dependent alcohol dehydrogenase n=1 Tax=Thermoanaerobacterium sp. DL9XJH110 TaxID=3386643 RepID=UPI003BB4B73C
MKALVLKKPRYLTIEQCEIPEYKDKALIKIVSAGICGSDLSAYKGTSPLGVYPRILGHEAAGTIVNIPDNEYGLKVGDTVAIEPYRYCGQCYPCSIGRTNCCENLSVLGVHQNGAFAEYLVHDIHLLHKVPENMTWEQIVMVEPLTISMHGVQRANIKENKYVVVTGAGTIGILAALYIRYLKAIPILVDPIDSRLKIAKKLGIDYVINPTTCDANEAIKSITNGRMAEVIVEASGSEKAVRSIIDYAGYTARISLVGYPHEEVPLPTFTITKKELVIKGSRNSAKLFPEAIELISKGHINVDPIISAVIDFDQLPEYFERIVNNPVNYLKVIASVN